MPQDHHEHFVGGYRSSIGRGVCPRHWEVCPRHVVNFLLQWAHARLLCLLRPRLASLPQRDNSRDIAGTSLRSVSSRARMRQPLGGGGVRASLKVRTIRTASASSTGCRSSRSRRLCAWPFCILRPLDRADPEQSVDRLLVAVWCGRFEHDGIRQPGLERAARRSLLNLSVA
jgi:hypothetical protein